MTPKKGNDKVDRRDFINGVLIAAGAAAVGGSLPMRAYDGGTTFLVTGRSAVIFAGQSHTARTACAQLLSASQADAFDQVTLSPVLVANVTIRSAAPVEDLGYDAYYWGSQYWADFVIADWVTSNRSNPHPADRADLLRRQHGIGGRSAE